MVVEFASWSMKVMSNKVLKLLGILLLTGAMLKGWQLLVEPTVDNSIWSYRPFLILAVEFELALGIWLLSGLFKKTAWLITLLCFSFFSLVTIYKAITGTESCGCFGSVHVNPWVTLFAIDLPVLVALVVFKPKGKKFFAPLPSLFRFAGIASFGLITLVTTSAVLAFNEPAKITSSYEVLGPETWIGKPLPVLKHIDIGEKLARGKWLLIFYRHDCQACKKEFQKYEQSASELARIPTGPHVAFVEIPPYAGPDENFLSSKTSYTVGKLSEAKDWFIQTPQIVTIEDGRVIKANRSQNAEKFLPASKTPLVAVSPIEINLGEISFDSRIEEKVLIENISEKPVFLRAETGCGCTKATLESNWLLPQQNTELQIRFKPSDRKMSKKERGQTTEQVALISSNNSQKYTTIVTVRAEVIIPSNEVKNNKEETPNSELAYMDSAPSRLIRFLASIWNKLPMKKGGVKMHT